MSRLTLNNLIVAFLTIVMSAAVIFPFNRTNSAVSLESQELAPITATSGEPELIEFGEGVLMPALTEQEYRTRTAVYANTKIFVPYTRKPANLSPRARFGFNFKIGDNRILSWALDGDTKRGYTLYADVNANGDLSDDTPLRFAREGNLHKLIFRPERTNQNQPQTVFQIVVTTATPPDEVKPRLCLRRFNTTFRKGVIQTPSNKLSFGLIIAGNSGLRAVFDLNNDGQLEMTPGSFESYDVAEKYIRIGSTDYEFVVGPQGQTLTLKPLKENLPATAYLRPGYPAPDFTFNDIDGRSRRLSDYRGKVVLLDFWGVWCGNCVVTAPELAATHSRLNKLGFDIIGIDVNDTEQLLRKFIADRKMSWAQTMETEASGELQKLFRVTSFPTYYLLAKDGTILMRKEGRLDHVEMNKKISAALKQ